MKIFFSKFLLLTTLILVLSLYIESRVTKDSQPFTNLKKAIQEGDSDIIYFGDSVLDTTDPQDLDQSSIPSILAKLTNKKVTMVGQPAYHTGLFSAYSQYLCKQSYKNKPLIIIPINLRSLSPEWNTRPSYQFTNEISHITSNKPKSSLEYLGLRIDKLFGRGNINDLSDKKAWEESSVMYKNQTIGQIKQFLPEPKTLQEISNKFIFQYLYSLSGENNKVIHLRQAVTSLESCGFKYLVYISPIDIQEATRLTGPESSTIIRNNIKIIQASVPNAQFLDLSDKLKHSDFYYKITPNEHLKEKGRLFVAQSISEYLFQKP